VAVKTVYREEGKVMMTCVVIQSVVIVCLIFLYFRNALYSDAAVQNAKIEIKERDSEIYNLKDDLAKLRHEYKEANSDLFDQCQQIRKYKDTVDGLNTECVRLQSEIQNLHSFYQRKLDDADVKLRLESQEFADEIRRAKVQWKEALEQLSQAQKSHYEDIAVLDRRLQDYDERIRASESARFIAESQMNSIREVCCGK
jgi:predicted  nucleic acid-binding Zn-ribbon protein